MSLKVLILGVNGFIGNALTACMRKLLTLLNILLKTNQPWQSKIAVDS